MALPIVLIHGYSSEGKTVDGANFTPQSLESLYGRLVSDLRAMGQSVVAVNVSRYISLDDGIDVDDIAFAFDRALRSEHPNLLNTGFNAIIHSTGALVARNWVRRHCLPDGKCPMKRIIHLAGANLGSGWAHIGGSQLAKFGRMLQGVQRGLAVLEDLELGSNWAIDLHTHFLEKGFDMLKDYGVMEFNVVGSQVPPEYLIMPTRYGKEDGSDGVVRVSASNLNFNYVKIGPSKGDAVAGRKATVEIDWDEAVRYARSVTGRAFASKPGAHAFENSFYEVRLDSRPGAQATGSDAKQGQTRPKIPFAIPYNTSHSDAGGNTAIVSGAENREEVLALIGTALNTETAGYAAVVETFDAVTRSTYEKVAEPAHAKGLLAGLKRAVRNILDNPKGQYDRHSQLVFRVCDQLGQPINDSSIFFNSFGGDGAPNQLMNRLFEDKHKNGITPNTLDFYLRTECWDDAANDWVSQLTGLNGVSLEIDAIDPLTNRILFLPLRMQIPTEELLKWIEPHRTTIVDIELLRLPHKATFVIR